MCPSWAQECNLFFPDLFLTCGNKIDTPINSLKQFGETFCFHFTQIYINREIISGLWQNIWEWLEWMWQFGICHVEKIPHTSNVTWIFTRSYGFLFEFMFHSGVSAFCVTFMRKIYFLILYCHFHSNHLICHAMPCHATSIRET